MTFAKSPLLLAAFMSGFLALCKLAAYMQTGSLIVLASFLDSVVDTFLSFVNSRVHKYARQAPDQDHPFGHGGFEAISSFVQGLFISFSGLLLIVQAGQRLLRPDQIRLGHDLRFSIGVMIFSAIGGALVSYYLRRYELQLQRQKDKSLSITTDRAHYLGDFFANMLGAAGLIAVTWTGIPSLDAIAGILGALGLLRVAFPILQNSFRDLVQMRIDPSLQREIIEAVMTVDQRIQGIHRLRSRSMGPSRFVDFHLKLPANMNLAGAHDLGERVARAIRARLPRTDVIIHLDPDSEPDDDLWDPAYKEPKNP